MFSCDSTIKVWDADSGEEVSTLRGHTGAVSSVVLVKTERSQGIPTLIEL